MMYRNADLLHLARLAPCCMSCGKESVGDVVASHSNRQADGKGMGIKSSDATIAFVCTIPCHHEIDQGRKTAGERQAMWEKAHRATMIWLVESGHLVVSIEPQAPPPQPVKPKAKVPSRKLQSRPFPVSNVSRKVAKRPWPTRAT